MSIIWGMGRGPRLAAVESACASLSLSSSELCKSKLTQLGKDGAVDALRCAD